MAKSKLQIVAVMPGGEPNPPKRDSNPQLTRRQESQARYERLWNQDPQRFDPFKDCWGRERIQRSEDLLKAHTSFTNKKCVDLGCGWGALTAVCAHAGATVDAIDIASQSLEKVKALNLSNVKTFQDYVPHTLLNDGIYDLVIASEIVAELPQQEYRLFFSELSRLVNKDGIVLCSTPLDIYSLDAFDKFRTFADTELEIFDWKFSYNLLWIKLGNVLTAPSKFGRACSEDRFRQKQIQERHGLNQGWFKINSVPIIGHFWKGMSFITNGIHSIVKQQRWLMIGLEKISEFFWNEHAISHVIILAHRKPLIPKVDPRQVPQERQQRRRVWE